MSSTSKTNAVSTSAHSYVLLCDLTSTLVPLRICSGTLELYREEKDELEGSDDFVIADENDPDCVVVAKRVAAWSIMNYLGSQTAQTHFPIIIGRFSLEIFKKQIELCLSDDASLFSDVNEKCQELLNYKKTQVSKHFAWYLTRCVDDILSNRSGVDDEVPPPLLRDSGVRPSSPALEFIKNVSVVLELDPDVEAEAHALKRSLLAQVGVAEYSRVAQWSNPCPRFILPDVFCTECSETRDVNLCYVPPKEDADEEFEKMWVCADCETPYDTDAIERRLIGLLHRKVARYQLQDVRCSKTNRVARRTLNPLVDCPGGLKLDITPTEAEREVKLLRSLAEFHDLESLKATTAGLIRGYR